MVTRDGPEFLVNAADQCVAIGYLAFPNDQIRPFFRRPSAIRRHSDPRQRIGSWESLEWSGWIGSICEVLDTRAMHCCAHEETVPGRT